MKYSEFFKMLEADKSRFINKLDTAEENKQLATDFFKKHPNYENEINWQSPDLSWEDIEEVMYKERISSTQLKNFVKKDKHFLVLYSDKNCVLFQPLTWLGSRYLASTDVKPKTEGKWCISYQKERKYWDEYSLDDETSFIIICTPTTKYALEISPEGTFVPWNAVDEKLNQSDFYDEISQEVPSIGNLQQKYIPVAINNHPIVEELHKKDLEECAYIKKVKEEEKQYRIKIFPKSFKRQVKKKGYYNWDGDITYDDLENLGLVKYGIVDEKFKYFKITGKMDFVLSPIYSITIPDSVTEIGERDFAGCKELKSVIIPDSVTSIGYAAFRNCLSLTEITIPYRVTSIDSFAFCGCSSLTKITIPNSVTTIGYDAFNGCESLTEITIPDSVKYIDGYTFGNCDSLKSVTFGKGVTSIGYFAFFNCESLSEITIPDSVTEIGDSVFLGCSSLKKVYIDKEKDSLDLSKACISNYAKVYWKGEF